MNRKLADSKHVWLLALLFGVTYGVSYISRLNYSVVMVEIVSSEGFTKMEASLALTLLFITYGVGQIVSGYLADKYNPKYVLAAGLLISAAMNFLMSCSHSSIAMGVIWAVNGFAQALMWPPIMRIMTNLMTADDCRKHAAAVSVGSSVATALLYFLCPQIIRLGGWRQVFVISAAIAFGMIFVWLPGVGIMEKQAREYGIIDVGKTQEKNSGGQSFSKDIAAIIVLITAAIAVHGILRDGITSWLPVYLSESFNIGNDTAIMSGVLIPILHVLSVYGASVFNRFILHDEMLCAAVIFGVIAVCGVFLKTAGGYSMISSALLMALMAGLASGINCTLTVLVPLHFSKFGNIGFVSGLFNAATYAGSAASTYGIAVIAEKWGWGMTISGWIISATIGIGICLITYPKWKKFRLGL